MKAPFIRVLAVALAGVLPFVSSGGTNDVDRTDPNFVTASLMVFGPGDELFSCAGHACIRLECPTYKLDYCFSYESEAISEKVLTFFAGRLKMGMFAIPAGEFFKQYVEDGRGCRQYRLDLPPAVKQRLWKIMDDKAAEGANLPYDYVRRGCAWSVLSCLRAALNPLRLEISFWPAKYDGTRREITSSELPEHPWKVFALHAIWGYETDSEVTKIEKVLMPNDLLEFLKGAKVNGVPVICGEGIEVLPQKNIPSAPFFTPMKVAILFALLAIVNLIWIRKPFFSLIFVAMQTLAGLFFAYLVFVSSLPATGWNWLLVPFNPLPLVFWRWRRYWAWGFVAVLLAWEAFMLLSPHQLTDHAYLVIVLAYVIFYAKVAMRERRNML